MSDTEKYGFRDNAYSAWHRPLSVSRFIDADAAEAMRLIDMDALLGEDMGLHESDGTTWVEFRRTSSWPLALIETAVDVGQSNKVAYVTQNMARISDLPGAVTLYKLSESLNPTDRRARDIDAFRVRRLWPHPELTFRNLSPQEYAEWLLRIRDAGNRRWGRFVVEETAREQAKEVWELLEEERERSKELSRALEREREKSLELMRIVETERKKTRKKPNGYEGSWLPFYLEEPPF